MYEYGASIMIETDSITSNRISLCLEAQLQYKCVFEKR